MTDLLQLAERCEKATGPDRCIDVTILATLHPDRFDSAKEARQYANAEYQRVMNNADWHYLYTVGLPRYTASLDAAMTLVPEGWMQFDVDATAPELGIDWTLHGPERREIKGTAETPALALCAAALRARGEGGAR